LREAIGRLNPAIPEEARQEALGKVLRVGTPSLTQTNRSFHAMLRDGVPVEYRRKDGSIAGDHVQLVDFDEARGNDWLVVNQFTVIKGHHHRRPDSVVFINGLPLAVIELKNAADEDATIWSAYQQLQTCKAEIGTLLHYNAVLVISDGASARIVIVRVIAAELVTQVRKSLTIDWAIRESARAKIKVLVKRILRKHGYPPDLQEETVKTVLLQAELLCADWAA
jgi:type I site-specific restriction-modification system R (restriction) subunit